MKNKIINILIMLSFFGGCTTFQKMPLNQNSTGINPYNVTEFPIPNKTITNCITGTIDEIISGNEATTIWHTSKGIVGLKTIRLPHTYPVRLKIVANGFCYDYFDVSINATIR